MKRLLLFLPVVLLFFACTSEKTDEALLEKDRMKLEKLLSSDKVRYYKFVKVLIRASAEKDTISEEFTSLKSDIDKTLNMVARSDPDKGLSVREYIELYRAYNRMSDFIDRTDEDIFPTVSEAMNSVYGGQLVAKDIRLRGDDKTKFQAMEHALLSVLVVPAKDLGTEISIYECAKTNDALLPESEEKSIFQLYKGLLYMQKELFYLSEHEIGKNLNWLNNNKQLQLPLTRSFFAWKDLNNEQTWLGLHAMNHMIRGFARLRMDREIDEQRALEDFDLFLNDTKHLGLDNELVWSIETYVNLKRENNERSVECLKKLKTSDMLSSKDKANIDEAIVYLEKRENGKVLNSFYDKVFMTRIASYYMLQVLAAIDWQEVLAMHDVPHAKQVNEMVDRVQKATEQIEKHASGESLKEAGEELRTKGEDLWNKTKGLIDN